MKFKNLLVICNNFPDKNNTYIGGIFVKEQINYLKKYFEEVYVISPVAYGVGYLRNINQGEYSFDNVHVYFPKYFNFPFFYFHGPNIWTYFQKNAILKLIKKENIKFDLIHAHFTWPSGAVAVELEKIFYTHVVITEHTSETFKNAIEKKDSKFIQTWKQCDAIIRVKKSDTSLFNNVGIPLEKIHHIPNGYNHMTFLTLDSHICRNNLGLPFDKKIILNVGNLYDAVKGHKYLIEAMREVVKHRNDVICFIVGGGKLESKLEKQITKSGLENYVKLVGAKPHNEISIWMNACDVFVLPSLNEGNPTVLVECLGCGKPFVGTKVGGIPEIITSEDYGLLCEPANSEYLAENILTALDKVWDKEKITSYAEEFTWQNIAKEILKVYENI